MDKKEPLVDNSAVLPMFVTCFNINDEYCTSMTLIVLTIEGKKRKVI